MQKVITAETAMEKEQAFEIRKNVFVKEQGVPMHLEMDEYDDSSVHFVGYHLEQPIAAGRIREIEQGIGKVERVCVLDEFRGQHVGILIMDEMEAHAKKLGLFTLKLHAQVHAIPFYEKLGYQVTSPEFLDADIPHRAMEKNLI